MWFCGLSVGIFITACLYFFYGSKGYYDSNNENNDFAIIIICITVLTAFSVFIGITILIVNPSPYLKLAGPSICLMVSFLFPIIFSIYTFKSTKGQYITILNKIQKIKDNLAKTESSNEETVKNARKILNNTIRELENQAHLILIDDSIKIAKSINKENKRINIEKEIDTLEALDLLKDRKK